MLPGCPRLLCARRHRALGTGCGLAAGGARRTALWRSLNTMRKAPAVPAGDWGSAGSCPAGVRHSPGRRAALLQPAAPGAQSSGGGSGWGRGGVWAGAGAGGRVGSAVKQLGGFGWFSDPNKGLGLRSSGCRSPGALPRRLAEAFSFVQLRKAGVSSAGGSASVLQPGEQLQLRPVLEALPLGDGSLGLPEGEMYQVLGLPNAHPRAGGRLVLSWREQGMAHAG